ncbi:uncharacterized protein LOC111307205 isoform X2 [Durio zibethinus]|uniref:Uncharacterized protein LOC111307205 isoform X2 n=1 Tax=Durio zibethinus TaxID=66656 RepID=A0A6P6A836_DURZI|nr:uncharacterized protein LOC111307205 isoform X2 [Durio zibethinus]
MPKPNPPFLHFFFFFDASMAIIRSMSQLNIKAPPPSPTLTSTGSRSAANESLTDFLEKSLHIPDLTLPVSQALHHQCPPEKIDFKSVALRETDSVERFMRSAREFGVVGIGWHGIDNTGEEELKALVKEAATVFVVLEEKDTGFRRYTAGKREEIVWVRCKDERLEWARQYIGPQLYQSFSEKMEKLASKLEEIAEELLKVLVENVSKQPRKRLQRGESLLSIYKYNYEHDKITDQNPHLNEEENNHSRDYTLSLHLPTKHCEFSVKSGPRILTFDAAPDTIIVTVGQQLEVSSFALARFGETERGRSRNMNNRDKGT